MEAATSGKVAAVAASAAALAGGGVAVTGASGEAQRPAALEHRIVAKEARPAARPAVTPTMTTISRPAAERRASQRGRSENPQSLTTSSVSEFVPAPTSHDKTPASTPAAEQAVDPGPGEFEP